MSNLEPGQAFGPYELQRRLARGGMGEIWLAERKGMAGFSKQVVIKTILEDNLEEPGVVQMFLDEGRIAANLHHPNIAQTYDLGEVKSTYYIAMEYVHGHDLRDLLLVHLEKGQLIPLNILLRVTAQVCDGLHYAHHWKTPEGLPAGIVHRDISPQNILVTFDGASKIIDFGIARAMAGASKTRTGVIKGKCAYMSPEQVQAESLDGRSDLFSLGVVMYELITGRRLFKRDTEMATLEAVIRTSIPPPTKLDPSVPKPVEELVLRALQRSPKKRFQTAQEMQLAVEEVMQATGLLATSAHLSAFMRKLFSEDVELNRERLRALKAKLPATPGATDAAAPMLERTKPFEVDLSKGLTGGTEGITRDLRGKRKGKGRGPTPLAWLLLAGLLALVAGGLFVLFYDFGGPAAGTDAGLAGEPALDAGPAAALDAGPAVPGLQGTDAVVPDAGAAEAEGADAGVRPPAADDRPAPRPPAGKRKKVKPPVGPKQPGDPKTDPLDIKLER
ncbi:MAG TPA: serine/threonine-protein kinase [Myxococcota bacterium]|nr:serine/threonine-protein kinase [Myxococcota bacterium]HRY95888.1 serine/threonine-protein kinase [Myxococcota bacterium]